MARIVAMMVVVVLAAMPAGALGATGGLAPEPAPEQPLLQPPPQEPAPSAPAPAPAPEGPPSATESRIGPATLLLVGVGIAALIGGIWFVIARDARKVTRGRRPQPAGGEGLGAGGSATRAARRNRRLSSAERRRRKRGRAR